MYNAIKESTLEYLESLPNDIIFTTSKRYQSRDELINEVKVGTKIGKEIMKVNEKYLSTT